MSKLPAAGHRKIVTAWIGIAVCAGAGSGAVAAGADAASALEVVVEGVVWVCGLVFGGNVGEHFADAVNKRETG